MSLGAILAGAALVQGGQSGKAAAATAYSDLNTNTKGVIGAIKSAWAKGAGKTLVTASQSLRVEPIVLCDERVARLSYATGLVEACNRLFSSYFVLSIAAENTVGSVTIAKRLGKFAPEKDIRQATADFLSFESYQFGLPFPGETRGLERFSEYCSESFVPYADDSMEAQRAEVANVEKAINDIGNLSVGQVINVNIVDGEHSANVPIMVRMRVIGASSKNMVNIMGLGAHDDSVSNRLRRFRVNELGLKDLITNQDIIDRYRSAVFNDKSGYFRKAQKQARKGLLSTFLTGEPSIGDISSMAIISRETLDEFRHETYVNLDDYASRQRLFEKTLLMMMLVVDDDSQTVTVYTRDIEDSQKYWLKDIEKAGKNGGNDLTDLLKSFLSGQIPGRL